MPNQLKILHSTPFVYWLLVTASLFCSCRTANAQYWNWVQPVDGFWSDASKWSPGPPPSNSTTPIRFTPPPPVGGGWTGVPNSYTSTNDLPPNPFQLLLMEITGKNTSLTNSPVVVTVNSPTPVQVSFALRFHGSAGSMPAQTFTEVLNADVISPIASTELDVSARFGNTAYLTGTLSEQGGAKDLFIATDQISNLVIQGTNQLTNRTFLTGQLTLDFSVTNTSKLSNNNSLVLSGVYASNADSHFNTLRMIGNASADSVQSVPNCVVPTFGVSTISAEGSGGHSATLNLGAISKATANHGTLLFQPGTGGGITTSNANSNNILGAWALFGNGDDFARVGPNSLISVANYDVQNDATLFAAGQNITNTAPFTGSAPTVTINSLRIANNTVLNIGAGNTLTLASGGVLMTSITSQAGIQGGTMTSTSGELLVHARSSGKLTIGSSITGTIDLIKYGPGTLELTGPISLNGLIGVHQGVLLVNTNQVALNRMLVVNQIAELQGNGQITFPNLTNQFDYGVRVYGTISPGNPSVNNGIGKIAIDWPSTETNKSALSIIEGHYNWQLGALQDNANGVMGIDWDGISTSAGGYSLGVFFLHLSFVGTANIPTSSDPFWQTSHTWTIIDNESPGFGGFQGNIENPDFGFGAFTAIAGTNNDLLLRWTVVSVPELNAGLLLALSALMVVGMIWFSRMVRRKRPTFLRLR